jgi:hypothetical protein
MSTGRYFVTDDQLAAKKWRMLEDGKALKQRCEALEDEVKKFAASWTAMGRLGSMPHGSLFRLDEKQILVLKSSRPMGESEVFPWKHFDADEIRNLLEDYERTRDEFEQKNESLKSYGIDLRREVI